MTQVTTTRQGSLLAFPVPATVQGGIISTEHLTKESIRCSSLLAGGFKYPSHYFSDTFGTAKQNKKVPFDRVADQPPNKNGTIPPAAGHLGAGMKDREDRRVLLRKATTFLGGVRWLSGFERRPKMASPFPFLHVCLRLAKVAKHSNHEGETPKKSNYYRGREEETQTSPTQRATKTMEYYDTVIGEDPYFATSFADWSDGEEDPALWNEEAREPARKRRPHPEGRDPSEEEERLCYMTGGRNGFAPDLETNPPPGMDNLAGCCTWLINGEAGDAVYL